MKHIGVLMRLVLSISLVYSQEKFERESRIKRSEVPKKASMYVESIFPDAKKTKWYLEENLDGFANEAKVRENGTIYSIKFDTLGNLQDIEFIEKFNRLPLQIQTKVESYLQEQYDRYRVKKIQVQWIGDADLLRSVLLQENADRQHEINYEIEFSGRKHGDIQSYEALFSEEGEHLNTKKIITRNLNHLVY